MMFGPKKPRVSRSPKWPEVRRKWLIVHNSCANCGEDKKLEVHHMMPVHWDASRELDPTNFITLCEQEGHNCHLIAGHLMDWKSRNPAVVEDTARYFTEKIHRPYP